MLIYNFSVGIIERKAGSFPSTLLLLSSWTPPAFSRERQEQDRTRSNVDILFK